MREFGRSSNPAKEPKRLRVLLTRIEEQYQAAQEALREACLHQGLPEDAPPDRIAAHFRNNREFRDSFPASDPLMKP